MKGSIVKESSFYHSFGNFFKHDFSQFDDNETKDFPINMDYDGIDELA